MLLFFFITFFLKNQGKILNIENVNKEKNILPKLNQAMKIKFKKKKIMMKKEKLMIQKESFRKTKLKIIYFRG